MKKYVYEETVISHALAPNIWRVLTNFGDWKLWDDSIEYIKLNSDLTVGSKGVLKHILAKEKKFEFIYVDEEKKLGLRVKMFLANVDFIFNIVEIDGDFYITEILEFSGLFGFWYSRVYGKQIYRTFSTNLKRLSERAEKLL